VSTLKEENSYVRELETKWHEARQLSHSLETELISTRGKINSYDELRRQLEECEAALMRKSDEANDLKRHNLAMRKEIESLQLACNDLTDHNNHLANEVNSLKQRLSQPLALSPLSSK
jgi:chromosome segregation ATPase